VIIPEEMKRVDVVDLLAAAGIYSSEDDVVYGKGESDSRNERMVLKAVGHLGHSDHKYNLPALAQLVAAWPASRTVPIDLDVIGAYSYTPRAASLWRMLAFCPSAVRSRSKSLTVQEST